VPSARHWRYTLTLPAAVEKEHAREQRLHNRVEKRRLTREKIQSVPLAKLESTEQTLFVQECVRRGWKAWKLTCAGRRGWPDTFVADPRTKRCAFIEMKSKDRRSKPTIAQKNTVQILLDCGQNAYIAYGARDALTYAQEIFE
jgi:hypothetical protein